VIEVNKSIYDSISKLGKGISKHMDTDDFTSIQQLPFKVDENKIDTLLLEYMLRNNLIDSYTNFQS
jgi:hypothetical protein